MGRLDNRLTTGRFFPTPFERERIDRDLGHYTPSFGAVVLWYFRTGTGGAHPVYDERDAFAGGLRWTKPVRIPVIGASNQQGTRESQDGGLYMLNRLELRLLLTQAIRSGMPPYVDLEHRSEERMGDRIVYDQMVFRPDFINVYGQFDPGGTDMTIRVQATEIRYDELVNDPEFQAWTSVAPPPKSLAADLAAGLRWWVGDGPPGDIPDALPGDFYLDQLTGDVWVLVS